jgi:MinD-like ATPase involved in chromosome partitioning or flagellar assembly
LKIIAYARPEQNDILLELRSLTPDIETLHNIHRLKQEDLLDTPHVLIIISQPTHKEQKIISELIFLKIIKFEGIRSEGFAVVVVDNAGDLEAIIKNAEKELKDRIRSNYKKSIETTQVLTDEEKHYLEKLSGERTEGKTRENLFKKFNKERVTNELEIRGQLTILGSGEAAAEIAKVFSTYGKMKVLLLDGNLLIPSMDVHFNIQNIQTRIDSHLKGIDNTGINIGLDAIAKNADFDSNLKKMVHRINPRLDVMLGNYNLYNYEHYDTIEFKVLLDKLKMHYDLIILSASQMPYDSLTLLGLHHSKINIFICENSEVNIRYCNNVIEILKSKQNISDIKFLSLLYVNGNHNSGISDNLMKGIFGKMYVGRLEGKSRKRTKRTLSILKKVEERCERWD